MGDRSKIEWCDASWNCIRGCSRVSRGCEHCYAERQALRGAYSERTTAAGTSTGPGPYNGLVVMKDAGPQWTGEVRFIPELLEQPLRWRRPRKIFVNSMSDLFHEKVQDNQIAAIFRVMTEAKRHTFQILTKRASRMCEYFKEPRPWTRYPLPNVWLGVSVEDQKTADERIPLLLQTPAAVRWVSYEPALGPVDFSAWPKRVWLRVVGDDGAADRGRIDWLVAGGESGPGARPVHPQWIRAARDQCMEAGVPFFFKQWGEWLNTSQLRSAFSDAELDRITFQHVRREPEGGKPNAGLADLYFRVSKKRAGHLLDGIPWQEFPAVHREPFTVNGAP
jgi:protein gp37